MIKSHRWTWCTVLSCVTNVLAPSNRGRTSAGVKPKVYVERLKINRAAEYLSSTDSSIAETALRFGYQDQYHFSRRFKVIMGVSPREYRKHVAGFYHRKTVDDFETGV